MPQRGETCVGYGFESDTSIQTGTGDWETNGLIFGEIIDPNVSPLRCGSKWEASNLTSAPATIGTSAEISQYQP